MTIFLLVIIAYIVGSIPFAIVFSKIFALPDPRKFGSGNPGATNVLRSGNKLAAALTFIGDSSKCAVMILLAQYFVPQISMLSLSIVSLASFLGHLYSLFLGFKGGKGVASSFGIFLVINPYYAFILLAVWVLVVLAFKISALAAIITALVAPFLYLILNDWTSASTLALITIMSVLLLYKHKKNINDLLTNKNIKRETNNNLKNNEKHKKHMH